MNLPGSKRSGYWIFPHRTLAAILLFSAVALILAAVSCQKKDGAADGDSVHLHPTQPPSDAKVAAAQNRVNAFFYGALVPKLTTCWNKVQGKGEIEFKFVYRKDGRSWVWERVEPSRSDLAKEQSDTALDCMKNSSSGSVFAMDSEELARDARTLTIYWSWPVPLPTDTTELAQMINTGGNISYGTRCKDCVYDPEKHKSYCAGRFGGWVNCVEDGDGSGCQMSGGRCLSGWSGVLGPISIARNDE